MIPAFAVGARGQGRRVGDESQRTAIRIEEGERRPLGSKPHQRTTDRSTLGVGHPTGHRASTGRQSQLETGARRNGTAGQVAGRERRDLVRRAHAEQLEPTLCVRLRRYHAEIGEPSFGDPDRGPRDRLTRGVHHLAADRDAPGEIDVDLALLAGPQLDIRTERPVELNRDRTGCDGFEDRRTFAIGESMLLLELGVAAAARSDAHADANELGTGLAVDADDEPGWRTLEAGLLGNHRAVCGGRRDRVDVAPRSWGRRPDHAWSDCRPIHRVDPDHRPRGNGCAQQQQHRRGPGPRRQQPFRGRREQQGGAGERRAPHDDAPHRRQAAPGEEHQRRRTGEARGKHPL